MGLGQTYDAVFQRNIQGIPYINSKLTGPLEQYSCSDR